MDKNELLRKLELAQSKLKNLQKERSGIDDEIEVLNEEIDELQKRLQSCE